MRLFKVHARHRGIGYREALDEALCFGWIDGVIRSLDEDSFIQRFTPRRTKSIWSAVNVKRYRELEAAGQVHASGAAAFARWDGKKAPYSFESAPRALSPELARRFRTKKRAWAFWEEQPPGYRRVMTHWVMSAKREETREKRLVALMTESAARRRVDFLDPPTRRR